MVGLGVAVSPDNARVYVANGGTNAVSVIDARTLRTVGRVAVGRRPWGLALSADGRWRYAADGIANQVAVIDTRTLRVVDTIRMGQRPWGTAVVR